MKHIRSGIFSLSMLIVFGPLAAFAELPDTLIIAKGHADYPPYQFTVNGALQGICPEMITHAAESLGISVEYEAFPWARMLLMAEKGKVDGVMPLFKTPERAEFLFYPRTPLALEENVFFTSKEMGMPTWKAIQDLEEYTIGVVRGYSYGAEFDQAEYLHKDEAVSEERLIKKFQKGRFQIGVGNKHVISFYARQAGIADDIVFLKPPLVVSPLYIGFSKVKGHKHLAEQFSRAIEEFTHTSRYQELLRQYGFIESSE